MRRFHLFEFEDMTWFPACLRNLVTEYLHFLLSAFNLYGAVIPMIKQALIQNCCHHIVDLCSGSSGPLLQIRKFLEDGEEYPVSITLTDKFPNLEAFRRLQEEANTGITFYPIPVEATQVPTNLKGFRTLFTSFHHFKPQDAWRILQNAAEMNEGIGIFELTTRDPLNLLLILLSPLYVLLLTPFMRPFKWQRILFTYLIPVVPFVAIWDGIVSILRTYSVRDLQALVDSLHAVHYAWDIGEIRGRFGVKIIYLIGYPGK